MPRLWNETAVLEAALAVEGASASSVVHHLYTRIGYVPQVALEFLATVLRVPLPQLACEARAMPRLKDAPLRSKTLYVCDGTECSLPRCRDLAAQVVRTLGVNFCDQTDDRALRLKPLRCREVPTTASRVMVDDEVFEISTLGHLEELLDSLMSGH
jgi:NADH-quinone oxidoreductase subunit E